MSNTTETNNNNLTTKQKIDKLKNIIGNGKRASKSSQNNQGSISKTIIEQIKTEIKNNITGIVTQINTTLTALQNDFTQTNTTLTALQNNFTQTNTTLTALQNDFTQTNTTLTTLQNDFTQTNTEVHELRKDMDDLTELTLIKNLNDICKDANQFFFYTTEESSELKSITITHNGEEISCSFNIKEDAKNYCDSLEGTLVPNNTIYYTNDGNTTTVEVPGLNYTTISNFYDTKAGLFKNKNYNDGAHDPCPQESSLDQLIGFCCVPNAQ